ncbi:phage tail protein [Zoogloea sp.]|uniref:phage tail protein n=1 Tax=Zoogloea sp. TaxID=49181 RepID=UPI001415656E|nr:MAG: tail fiber protein [Zoogloea sp.]
MADQIIRIISAPTEVIKINTAVSPVGPAGRDGVDGKSAFELAVQNGFVGTEVEFLASLKGDTGASGGSTQIGEIRPIASSIVPTGWLLCDGSAVSRTLYADLFTAIGTAYGAGDGITTFNVPDMRSAELVGASAALGDAYKLVVESTENGIELATGSAVTGLGAVTVNFIIAASAAVVYVDTNAILSNITGIGNAGKVLSTNGTSLVWIDNASSITSVSQLVNDSGYLTTETEPAFTASAAKSITAANVTNWNTAYGWGNHASAGYIQHTSVSALTDVTLTAPVADNVLKYDGTKWVNATSAPFANAVSVTSDYTDPATKYLLFATNTSGYRSVRADDSLVYNALTNVISIAGHDVLTTASVAAAVIDDASTTSISKGWSANKLNTTLGDISSALAAIIG